MADKRIDDFTQVSSLSDSDVALISSGGVTLKATVGQFRGNVPKHNTTIGPMSAGCFGFITSGGADLVLFFPVAYYTKTNVDILQTGSVAQCDLAVRHVGGGYVLGSGASALEYLTTCVLLSEGRGIQMAFTKSGGFGVTNNTPVSGLAIIAVTF